jgi:hypothetical protein
LRAEDERQGRVPGHPSFHEWFLDLRVLLAAAVLVACGIGWLGSKVGIPDPVGRYVAAAILIPLACVALYKYYRGQRR